LSVEQFAFSSDFGKIGETYPIAEEDLLQVIKKKVKEKDLKKLNAEYKQKMMSHLDNLPSKKLPSAKEYRAVELVPSYTLDKDIYDHRGNILFKKGTTVNSLDVRSLSKMICFINGDSEDQIIWAQKHCSLRDKIVLVQGKYLEVSKRLGRQIFFDQRGILVDRLKIAALPATLRQLGKKLYVEEHLIN